MRRAITRSATTQRTACRCRTRRLPSFRAWRRNEILLLIGTALGPGSIARSDGGPPGPRTLVSIPIYLAGGLQVEILLNWKYKFLLNRKLVRNEEDVMKAFLILVI